ncbi:hypothetical protein [Streptomyces venezuelae]|nr:hypothetical protein [Streptomyces venezuelae]
MVLAFLWGRTGRARTAPGPEGRPFHLRQNASTPPPERRGPAAARRTGRIRRGRGHRVPWPPTGKTRPRPAPAITGRHVPRDRGQPGTMKILLVLLVLAVAAAWYFKSHKRR